MKSYRPLLKNVSKYWKQYGGMNAVAQSPYFHLALSIAILNFISDKAGWAEKSFSLLPSLIGLTLAGYAVMLSVVSDKILALLSKRKEPDAISNFENFNTTFFHFVFVQSVALFFASAGGAVNGFSLPTWLANNVLREDLSGFLFLANKAGYLAFNFLGSLLLYYSITLILATLLAIYRIANVLQIFGEEDVDGSDGT
jgi:hypothetical protein